MDQQEPGEEISLVDYLQILWKRRWLIVVPTLLLVAAVGLFSFLAKPVWEVDSLIQPSKFFVQTQQGQYEEVVVIDPKQVAGQINQKSYNNLLAAELNIETAEFPRIQAEALRDTKLVRVWVRDPDPQRGARILTALFSRLKIDYDKRIDVEIKSIDTEITEKSNTIKDRENEIKSIENEIQKKKNDLVLKDLEIQSKGIEKERLGKEIEGARNKLKISAERQQSILDEMKSVKGRIDELEARLQNALQENKQSGDAVALLLYSNEVQQNLRYYNTLDEKISTERITQENLTVDIRDREQQIKQLDNQADQVKTQKNTVEAEIGTLKNNVENIRNAISTITSDIKFLENKKARIDYTVFIKTPTSSLGPVAPKKKQNILIAGISGLLIFGLLAFFLEYVDKNKAKPAQK